MTSLHSDDRIFMIGNRQLWFEQKLFSKPEKVCSSVLIRKKMAKSSGVQMSSMLTRCGVQLTSEEFIQPREEVTHSMNSFTRQAVYRTLE